VGTNDVAEPDALLQFCRRLGVADADPALMALALRHTSHVREAGLSDAHSNERLEFLGDAVLDLVLADHLFSLDSELSEGELTRLKSTLAQEAALAGVGRRMGLGAHLSLGRGEEDSGGRERSSIIADAVEALIAAVYLSGGLESAREFILTHFSDEIDTALHSGPAIDPKTALQELIQERTKQLPQYHTKPLPGPPHEPRFQAECRFAGAVIGSGVGRSKREAEKAAARSALADPDAVYAAVVRANGLPK
jgi:ribonuclease-3